MGDFNLDLAKPSSRQASNLLSLLISVRLKEGYSRENVHYNLANGLVDTDKSGEFLVLSAHDISHASESSVYSHLLCGKQQRGLDRSVVRVFKTRFSITLILICLLLIIVGSAYCFIAYCYGEKFTTFVMALLGVVMYLILNQVEMAVEVKDKWLFQN